MGSQQFPWPCASSSTARGRTLFTPPNLHSLGLVQVQHQFLNNVLLGAEYLKEYHLVLLPHPQ